MIIKESNWFVQSLFLFCFVLSCFSFVFVDLVNSWIAVNQPFGCSWINCSLIHAEADGAMNWRRSTATSQKTENSWIVQQDPVGKGLATLTSQASVTRAPNQMAVTSHGLAILTALGRCAASEPPSERSAVARAAPSRSVLATPLT